MGSLKGVIKAAFQFIPHDPEFPDKLVEQAILLQQAAAIFKSIVDDWSHLHEGAKRLEELEHTADQLVHRVKIELRQVWLPDIDKEDPKLLTELIDDVIDHIEEATNRLVLFEIPCSTPKFREIARYLIEIADHIHRALVLLQKNQWKGKEFVERYQAIHTVENEGDKIHRAVLPQLFNLGHLISNELIPERQVLEQMELARKLNVVYQTLEDAFDKAEDIAIALEHIYIKGGPRWKFSFF